MSAAPLPAGLFPSPVSLPTTHAARQPEIEPEIELETLDCPLCEGSRFDTIIVGSEMLTGQGGNFRVVRCCDCGLHFTNPRPTPRSIGQFYPDSYHCWDAKTERTNLRARVRLRLEHLVLRRFFGYPRQPVAALESFWANVGAAWISRSEQRQDWIPWRAPGRLLDFGCGGGDFLVAMRRHGWNVQGLDFSESCARGVTERTGIPVHVGTLPHPAVEPESFDAVTLWNSLEHVHDPRAIVQAACEALRPGGVIVVGVPNIDSWGFRTFGHAWYPLDLPRHLIHFTPLTLRELLHREGFQVRSIDHIARPHFLRKSARRAAQSGHGPRWLRLLQQKQPATITANWTARTQQADFIRAIAEKR